MKIHNDPQGSDEWLQARLGKFTASQFDKLITRTGKKSAQCEDMINQVVAELILGRKELNEFVSDAMLRGQALENEALEFFNFTKGYKFEKIGFVEASDMAGCSPDGIDFEARMGLELKCPLAHNHVKYLIDNCLPDKYWQQVQGSMLITGMDRWVFGSYHPDLPCFSVVVDKDVDYCGKLDEILKECVVEVKKRLEQLESLMEG
jgi:hypothetical protein